MTFWSAFLIISIQFMQYRHLDHCLMNIDKERFHPKVFVHPKYNEDYEVTLTCTNDIQKDSFKRTDSKEMRFNATCPDLQTFLFTAKSSHLPKHPII